MKTRIDYIRRQRRSTGGSAVLVLLALLAVMLMLIAANTAVLNRLEKDMTGLEKRQIQRLDASAKTQLRPAQEATNQPAR
jgi:type VI protein secretion system component VasK